MRRFLIIAIIIGAVWIHASNAQTPTYTCDNLTDALDIAPVCEQISYCDQSETLCLQQGVSTLLELCQTAQLSNCEIRSVVYWIINHHLWGNEIYLWHPDGFEASFRAVVNHIDNGDYESALLEFEDIARLDDYQPYFTLELLHSILYYANGNYEDAFEHLDNSINAMPEPWHNMLSEYDNPLAYYFRGQIYRIWGDEERALQDFYLYDFFALPELKARLPLASFSLQMQSPQTWVLYPVFARSTYGYNYADHSLDEPRNILISYGNDQDTLIVAGLLERRFQETPEILFLQRDLNNPSNYYLNLNQQEIDAKPESYHLEIRIHPTYIEYYETIWHLEGLLTNVAIVLPDGSLDMRQNVTNRLCEDNTISFINLGDTLLKTSWQELNLVDSPTDNNVVVDLDFDLFEDESNPVVVIDGAQCFDSKIWWQVSNGEFTGWLYEVNAKDHDGMGNTDSIYQFMPGELIDSWIVEDPEPFLYGVPTPLEFLGLANEAD